MRLVDSYDYTVPTHAQLNLDVGKPGLADTRAETSGPTELSLDPATGPRTVEASAEDKVESAMLNDGSFVVVFRAVDDDGNGGQVVTLQARQYGANGQTLSPSFQINTTDLVGFGDDDFEVIATDSGGFAIAYIAADENPDNIDSQSATFFQQFDSNGQRVGDEVKLSQTVLGRVDDVRILQLEDGSFFTAWSRFNGVQLFEGRQLASDGSTLGDEFDIVIGERAFSVQLAILEGADGRIRLSTNSGLYVQNGDVSTDGTPTLMFDKIPDNDPNIYVRDEILINNFTGSSARGEREMFDLGDGLYAISDQRMIAIIYENEDGTGALMNRVNVAGDPLSAIKLKDGGILIVAKNGDTLTAQTLSADYATLSDRVEIATLDGASDLGISLALGADGRVMISWVSGTGVNRINTQLFEAPDIPADQVTMSDIVAGSGGIEFRNNDDLLDADYRNDDGQRNRIETEFFDVGDLNGDGVDDFIINLEGYTGTAGDGVFILDVTRMAINTPFTPGNENSGTVLENPDGGAGRNLYSLGDINNDGFTDFYMQADTPSAENEHFVVLGVDGGLPGSVDFANIFGGIGFSLRGDNIVVRSADLNGDGIDDVMIQSERVVDGMSGNYITIIEGREGGFFEDIYDADSLFGDGTSQFRAENFSLESVEVLGDLNQDGFDDFKITIAVEGGFIDDHIVFGGEGLFSESTDFQTLDGFDFIDLNTQAARFTGDSLGSFVAVQDMNGDGFSDLITTSSLNRSGDGAEINVFYGTEQGISTEIRIADIEADATLGYQISRDNPNSAQDRFDMVVGGGDFNGDGLADLLTVMSGGERTNGDDYLTIILGSENNLESTSVSEIGDSRIIQIALDDTDILDYGFIGDVNGDGADDVGIRSAVTDGPREASADTIDILFGYGANGRTLNGGSDGEILIGSFTPDRISGFDGDDEIDGGNGDDTLFGNFGQDTVRGGAGNDVLVGDNDIGLSGLEGIIYRSFRAVFDRDPDLTGFQGYLQEILINNLTIADMLAEFIASAEFQSVYGDLSNIDFINQLYRNVFDREGDAEGVANYLAALEAGAITRTDIITDFVNSVEFIQLTSLEGFAFATSVITAPGQSAVFRLYQAVFDRLPDAGGFNAYVSGLEGNVLDLAAIALEFVSSAEFQATYGELDNTAFIELLYQNIFNRAADSGGLQTYLAALEGGALTRAGVVLDLAQSNEFRQLTQDAMAAFVDAFNNLPGDILDGGLGDDMLFGGRGADLFQFDTDNGGNDTIGDFQRGVDTIGGFEDMTLEEIQDMAEQVGANTVITTGLGTTLTLNNTVLTDLVGADFRIGASVGVGAEPADEKAAIVPIGEALGDDFAADEPGMDAFADAAAAHIDAPSELMQEGYWDLFMGDEQADNGVWL